MKYILFGAGANGKEALKIIDKKCIEYFIDNDKNKQGMDIEGIPVYHYAEKQQELNKYRIIVTASEPYANQMINQLKESGVCEFDLLKNLRIRRTREKINSRLDYIGIYKDGIKWIQKNIAEESDDSFRQTNPEIAGSCIPSLIRWGYRELAIQYVKWLCGIQSISGAWQNNSGNIEADIFDTARILGGLLEARSIYSSVDESVKRGCEWLVDKIQELDVSNNSEEQEKNNKSLNIIYLCCLSPLIKASKIYDEEVYNTIALKALSYYRSVQWDKEINCREISDIYIYIMEALTDMGETETVQELLDERVALQNLKKTVSECGKLHWLFQIASIYYRLGDLEYGNEIFEYACELLRKSDGWDKVCENKNNERESKYFLTWEVSRSIKYFLDTLYYKIYAMYNNRPYTFQKNILKEDGRYIVISKLAHADKPLKVLDVGCGTGRYLKNLLEDAPQNTYFAVDFSQQVLDQIEEKEIIKCWGRHCQLPFSDNEFDYVYSCEAFCHVIDIESGIREMVRVTKEGGVIAIVDKNKDNYGVMDIAEWEQWFDEKELKGIMSKYCKDIQVYSSIPYEGKRDSLFSAWIGVVR